MNSPTSLPRAASAALHASFVLNGIATTLLGPLLPLLAARWAWSNAQAGTLFTLQFLGSTVGVLLSGELARRGGFRFALVLGYAAMCVGAGALSAAGPSLGLIAVLSAGVGLGVTIPTTNLLVAQSNPRRRAAALNLLNLAWGVGAVSWPWIVGFAEQTRGERPLLVGLATALGLAATTLASISFGGSARPVLESGLGAPALEPAKIGPGPILAALFFLYVGTESAVGGWVASYARDFSSGSARMWIATPSFFWGALLVGRALAPVFLRRIREAALTRWGLLLAALGIGILILGSRRTTVVAGASLAGLGLSTVFPATIALLAASFEAAATRFGGIMFALGGLGGATLPWLVGYSSTRLGGLRAGLALPLVCCVLMVGLHAAYPRSAARQRERPTR